jgi:hypothetical protein
MIVSLRQTWIFWILLILYLLLRFVLFDGALHVYQQQLSFTDSLIHNIVVFPQVFSMTALAAWHDSQTFTWFWVVFFVVIILSFWLSIKNDYLNKWLMIFTWILITLLALISQIGSVDSSGAGARVLYTVSAWFAVILVVPLLFSKNISIVFYLILTVLLGYVQYLPVQQWSKAAIISKKLLQSVDEIPPLNNDKQWDLVLIPDHIGVGLLGRTGQGGFSMPPFRSENVLDKMIPFISSDLEIWRDRQNNHFMASYKTNVSDPNQYPTRYYCTNKQGKLVELSINQDDLTTEQKWFNIWQQQTTKLDCYF